MSRGAPDARLLATGCVVIAMLAAIVTLPLAWVASNIADEDGYVAFTSPMGSDPELQKAFSAYLSDYFVREQGLPSAAAADGRDGAHRRSGEHCERPGIHHGVGGVAAAARTG